MGKTAATGVSFEITVRSESKPEGSTVPLTIIDGGAIDEDFEVT